MKTGIIWNRIAGPKLAAAGDIESLFSCGSSRVLPETISHMHLNC